MDSHLPGLAGQRSGAFIAFEGADGVGKSTQVKALQEKLGAAGRESIVVREPGGTAAGEHIRQLLLHKTDCQLSLSAELLLFLASRVQLYSEVIAPALESNTVVISDRYHISSLVYQGWAAHQPPQHDHFLRVAKLVECAIGDRRPDLNIIVELPWEECQKRLSQNDGGDRFEERVEFQKGLWQAFKDCPGLAGDRIRRVSGQNTVENVANEIWREVSDVL